MFTKFVRTNPLEVISGKTVLEMSLEVGKLNHDKVKIDEHFFILTVIHFYNSQLNTSSVIISIVASPCYDY